MADNRRQVLVSAEACIGCRACATICPAGLIVLTDTGHTRAVRFELLCAEDCVLCAGACPVQAIALEPVVGRPPASATELGFRLVSCTKCGSPVTTEEMLAHLRAVIPSELQVDAEGQTWLGLCSACRQRLEAGGVAREGIMTRWPV